MTLCQQIKTKTKMRCHFAPLLWAKIKESD